MALFRRKSDDERDPEAVARWDALQNMLDAHNEPDERPREDAPAPNVPEPPPWQQQESWRHHEVGPEPAPHEPAPEMNGHAAAEPAAGWDSWDSVISSTSFDEPSSSPAPAPPPAVPAPEPPRTASAPESPATGAHREPEESTVDPEPAPADPGAGLISSGVPWNSARIVLPAQPNEPETPTPQEVSPPPESEPEPEPAGKADQPITWTAAPIADPGSLSWVEPSGSLDSARPAPADPRLTARPGPQSFDLPEHVRRNDAEPQPAAEDEAPPAPEPSVGPGQIPPQQFQPPQAPLPGPPPPQQWHPQPPPANQPQWQPPANQPPPPPAPNQPPAPPQQWQPAPPPQQWPGPPAGTPAPPPGPAASGPPSGPTPQAGPPTGPTPQAGPPTPPAGEPPQPPETPPFVWTDDFESGPTPNQPAPAAPDQRVANQPAPNPPGGFTPALPPGPYQPGTQDPAPYVHRPGPSVDDLTASALVDRRSTPQAGWRKAVYRISAHAVNPGISRSEQRRRDLINQATVPVHGCYRIAVISLKGGVGKTTTTVCLGATLASLRGDRVIAVDANPDRGTLSGKIPVQTTATVRNLLNDVDRIERYSDVRRYTSQSPDRLEVLASESDPSVSLAFSEADYRRVAGVLERYYNVVLTDCGTGLLHSAMAGVLAMANQLVVVSSGSVDGARSASATIDWLEAHGYSRLVAGSVAVINSVRPKSGGVNLDALEEHFASRCRAVTRIPYDPHLELGAEVDLAELAAPTREALLELAADVAAGFPRPESPPPPPMQPYDGPR